MTSLFGLEVTSDFAIAGVPERSSPGRTGRRLSLRRVPRAELYARWPGSGAQPLTVSRGANGRRLHPIDRHPRAGTLMRASGWGAYLIDPAAEEVLCAPLAGRAAWNWQRYLIGQVLPYVAVLRGLEAWHAAAVLVDGAAALLVGRSKAGKSSLAAALLERGGTLIADDVSALELRGRVLFVNPAPGLLSLRHDVAGRFPGLGAHVGTDEEAVRLAVPRAETAAQVGAIFVLDRDAKRTGLEVRHDPAPDPRLLIGATFNLVERDSDRLVRMLDVSALASRTIPLVHLRLGRTVEPGTAARAVERVMAE